MPVTVETNPNAIPMEASANIIVQAQRFPFNNP